MGGKSQSPDAPNGQSMGGMGAGGAGGMGAGAGGAGGKQRGTTPPDWQSMAGGRGQMGGGGQAPMDGGDTVPNKVGEDTNQPAVMPPMMGSYLGRGGGGAGPWGGGGGGGWEQSAGGNWNQGGGGGGMFGGGRRGFGGGMGGRRGMAEMEQLNNMRGEAQASLPPMPDQPMATADVMPEPAPTDPNDFNAMAQKIKAAQGGQVPLNQENAVPMPKQGMRGDPRRYARMMRGF